MKFFILVIVLLFSLGLNAQSKGDFIILQDNTRIEYPDYKIKNGQFKTYMVNGEAIFYDDIRYIQENGELRAYIDGFSSERLTTGKISVFTSEDHARRIIPAKYYYAVGLGELKVIKYKTLKAEIIELYENAGEKANPKVMEKLEQGKKQLKLRNYLLLGGIGIVAFGLLFYSFGILKDDGTLALLLLGAIAAGMCLFIDPQDALVEAIELFNSNASTNP